MEAVHKVRRNKEACKQLVQRVQMIADLLQSMQSSEMMQRPETRKPLNGLEEALRRAYILITSCQNSSYMYRFFMGEKLASQFSEVQNNIDFYLQLFPVISHIDTTHLLVRILNGVRPPQQEAAAKLRRSFTSHSTPHSRTEISGSLERVQAITEPFKVMECQVAGPQNVVEALPTRKRKMRWPWKEANDAPYIVHGLIGHKGTGFMKFSFSQLLDATNNFSTENKIGLGGFSIVYKESGK